MAVMADAPTLADAVSGVYAVPPAEFVRARDDLVKQAKDAGDTDLVGEVKALRKPSVAAYLVNQLSREDGALDPLRDLGEQLRSAQSSMDGATMKSLAGERQRVVAELTDTACAGQDQVTASTREQVSATFTAALADPQAERAVASGALVSALKYSGFGEVDITGAVATPLRVIEGGGETTGPEKDRETARDEAARRAARTAVARASAKLERADDALQSAQSALEQARERVAEARAREHRTLDAVRAAETERDSAQAMVEQAEAALDEE